MSQGQLPSTHLPYVEGDFNACGWGGNGDMSIYSLNKEALSNIPATEGREVFLWSDDDNGDIFGNVAILEFVTLGGFVGWRARPVPGTNYRGPKPSHLVKAFGA